MTSGVMQWIEDWILDYLAHTVTPACAGCMWFISVGIAFPCTLSRIIANGCQPPPPHTMWGMVDTGQSVWEGNSNACHPG